MRQHSYLDAMDTDDKMLIIRRNDFFVHLSPEDYESLNIVHNFIIADKNAFIYFDAPNHNKLYFIKDGYVKLGHVDDEGNEVIKDVLLPGDVFGQFTLEKQNMSGEFAQAYKSDVSLCAFTIQDFETLLHNKPALAVQFSKKIGQKLRRVENRLMNLLQKDARSRLLYFFYTLLQNNGDIQENGMTLTNYLTHEDIARLTGTSRQTVTTLISQFEDEGFLEVDRKKIKILDLKRLLRETRVG